MQHVSATLLHWHACCLRVRPPCCTMLHSFGQPCSTCCNMIQCCMQHVAAPFRFARIIFKQRNSAWIETESARLSAAEVPPLLLYMDVWGGVGEGLGRLPNMVEWLTIALPKRDNTNLGLKKLQPYCSQLLYGLCCIFDGEKKKVITDLYFKFHRPGGHWVKCKDCLDLNYATSVMIVSSPTNMWCFPVLACCSSNVLTTSEDCLTKVKTPISKHIAVLSFALLFAGSPTCGASQSFSCSRPSLAPRGLSVRNWFLLKATLWLATRSPRF